MTKPDTQVSLSASLPLAPIFAAKFSDEIQELANSIDWEKVETAKLRKVPGALPEWLNMLWFMLKLPNIRIDSDPPIYFYFKNSTIKITIKVPK